MKVYVLLSLLGTWVTWCYATSEEHARAVRSLNAFAKTAHRRALQSNPEAKDVKRATDNIVRSLDEVRRQAERQKRYTLLGGAYGTGFGGSDDDTAPWDSLKRQVRADLDPSSRHVQPPWQRSYNTRLAKPPWKETRHVQPPWESLKRDAEFSPNARHVQPPWESLKRDTEFNPNARHVQPPWLDLKRETESSQEARHVKVPWETLKRETESNPEARHIEPPWESLKRDTESNSKALEARDLLRNRFARDLGQKASKKLASRAVSQLKASQ